MDVNSVISSFKENGWMSLVLLVPFFVNLIGLLTASKLEKQLFKPKQKIYTRTLALCLHSTSASVIASILFLIMGKGDMITNIYFMGFIFGIYLLLFLILMPIVEAFNKPIHFIEDSVHGKLYLQYVNNEGNLVLFSKPDPTIEDGFYVIKEDRTILNNSKIFSLRRNNSDIIKKIFILITKPFKKNQNVSP